MVKPILVMYAGDKTPATKLLEALEAIHNDSRASTIVELARRKADNIPLNDGDGEIVDPGPFKRDVRLEGITVTPRIIAPALRRTLEGDYSMALSKKQEAKNDRDSMLAVNEIYAARRAYVAVAIEEVSGLTGTDATSITFVAGDDDGGQLPSKQLEALEINGLIDPIFAVARRAQGLPQGKE